MKTLQWTGTFRSGKFSDVGSPDDPNAVVVFDVQGIASTDVWNGSPDGKLLGTASSDLIFLDSIQYFAPRLVGIAEIHAGAGDDLVDFTSDRFSYGAIKIWGGSGADWILGNSGGDQLWGESGNDRLKGYGGNDVLNGGTGSDELYGGANTDTASYAGATKGVIASLSDITRNTNEAKGDTYVSIEGLTGSNHADKLYGNGVANLLTGGSGNDLLNGGSGSDTLYGGLGADDLVGGAGADAFVFKALADTTVSTSGRDTIFDFSGTGGDRIDLSAIDANSAASGNQAFTYLGTAAFTGKAGELRYIKQASDTYVYGDTNGDKKADIAIHLDDAISLSKGYFVL